MKRLINSVQKIHQSEESKAALLEVLAQAEHKRHRPERAVRWVAVAACLVLTAVVIAVGVAENKTPAAQLSEQASENTEIHIVLRLESYRAGAPAQAIALGEKQAAPADTTADDCVAYYAFRALNTASYDRIYVGLRKTTANADLPLSLFFGIENTETGTVYAPQMITEFDQSLLFERHGCMLICSKASETGTVNSATQEWIFRLGCPKGGSAAYGIVAENDAENTRTLLEVELTEKDGTVTAELLSQSISKMDGNAERPSVSSEENVSATAP